PDWTARLTQAWLTLDAPADLA
ncbi:MAG: hypothetical protein RLZZ300_943, partial [Pseudomonadota bacterium]